MRSGSVRDHKNTYVPWGVVGIASSRAFFRYVHTVGVGLGTCQMLAMAGPHTQRTDSLPRSLAGSAHDTSTNLQQTHRYASGCGRDGPLPAARTSWCEGASNGSTSRRKTSVDEFSMDYIHGAMMAIQKDAHVCITSPVHGRGPGGGSGEAWLPWHGDMAPKIAVRSAHVHEETKQMLPKACWRGRARRQMAWLQQYCSNIAATLPLLMAGSGHFARNSQRFGGAHTLPPHALDADAVTRWAWSRRDKC